MAEPPVRERQAQVWKAGAECLQSARSFHRQVNPIPTCRITGSTELRGLAQEFPAAYISSGKRRKNADRVLHQTLGATQLLAPIC